MGLSTEWSAQPQTDRVNEMENVAAVASVTMPPTTFYWFY